MRTSARRDYHRRAGFERAHYHEGEGQNVIIEHQPANNTHTSHLKTARDGPPQARARFESENTGKTKTPGGQRERRPSAYGNAT